MKTFLHLVELEERIAPTVITAGGSFSFTDDDGDLIRITYGGPPGSEADVTDSSGGDISNSDTIGWISVTGSDHSSVLLVENLGGGDGVTTIVNGVESATNGANFGAISLGVDVGGDAAGIVDLAPGAQILVDGHLGEFILNGDIDFDVAGEGHLILAQGDIGLVDVWGDMALDPTNGARIVADDISFINVEGTITQSSGGPEFAEINAGASYVVTDDNGGGALGTLTVKPLGGSALLRVIPVIGGGSVLSSVQLSDGAGVNITGGGKGGDVGTVFSSGGITTVTLSGSADMDLLGVSATSIGSVINKSYGGDIVGVDSTGNVGLIQTGRLGNLGVAFTSTRNSYPLVINASISSTDGSTVAGHITSIKVGGILNTDINAASIGSITAYPGGFSGVDIDVTGAIGYIKAASIESTTISADGIAGIKVNGAGIMNSEISSTDTIGYIQTPGSITGSLITTAFKDGPGNVTGADIVKVQAGALYSSQIEAFGGFGSVRIKGVLADSQVASKFVDDMLGEEVGAGIGKFSAWGMGQTSTVAVHTDIGSFSIGAGGMNEGSSVIATGMITKASVRGDVVDFYKPDPFTVVPTTIYAGAGIGSLLIGGEFAYNALIATGPGGHVGSIKIGGGIVGADISLGGNLTSLTVNGGISGVGSSVVVAGSAGAIKVSGGIWATATAFNVGTTLTSLTVRGGVSNFNLVTGGALGSLNFTSSGLVHNTVIDIGGALTKAKIGDAVQFTASVAGDVGSFTVGGGLANLSQLTFDGSVNSFSVRHDANNSTISIDGNAGKVSFGGNVGSTQIDILGDAADISAKGSLVSVGVNIGGDLGKMSVGRGIYGCYLGIEGSTGTFTVKSSIHDSQTIFDDGVGTYTVKGSLYNVNIGNREAGGGAQLGSGALGKLSAQDINGSTISFYGGIGEVSAKGTIYDATIESMGTGASEGSILSLKAKGLNGTDVIAFNSIGAIVLGDEGVQGGATIVAQNGNLTSLTTKGIIYGDVTVGGDLLGSINSAGEDAADLGNGVDYYFVDANGVMTGGTLDVTGAIIGLVS